MVWTLPAQASWEEYQQAGEAAYERGDYATAQRMFLAAVREAENFGPQDPRLDISLNKLGSLQRRVSIIRRTSTLGVTKKIAHPQIRQCAPWPPAATSPSGSPACQVRTSTPRRAVSAPWRAPQRDTDHCSASSAPCQAHTPRPTVPAPHAMWPRQYVMGSSPKRYTRHIADRRCHTANKAIHCNSRAPRSTTLGRQREAQSGTESSQMMGTTNGCVGC